MSKFTPGPWHVETRRPANVRFDSIVRSAKGDPICFTPDAGYVEAEAEANARLIAAAPDLYGLVEAVIETYEAHEDRHAQSVLKRLYDKATALRAKARGEA